MFLLEKKKYNNLITLVAGTVYCLWCYPVNILSIAVEAWFSDISWWKAEQHLLYGEQTMSHILAGDEEYKITEGSEALQVW